MSKVLIIFSLLAANLAFAEPSTLVLERMFLQKVSVKSLCGKDDRWVSDIRQIGRLVSSTNGTAGCTGTMISRNCVLTAGHCGSVIKFIQFNVPRDGRVTNGNDVYAFDPTTVRRVDKGEGNDWAVAKLRANGLTGQIAGDVQGFLKVSTATPALGTQVSVTGYGDSPLGFIQQAAVGPVVHTDTNAFQYQADTNPGNSGGSVIDVATGEILGVHTNGGCSGMSGNTGTIINTNPALQEAIAACLASDQ